MDTLGQIRGIRLQETSNFLDIDILPAPRLEKLEQEAAAEVATVEKVVEVKEAVRMEG